VIQKIEAAMQMKARVMPGKFRGWAAANSSTVWVWLSLGAVVLAVAGNILALLFRNIYASLTAAFLPQAIAQDIASLVIVSPLWILFALLALRGSLRAYLLWLGVLTFTVYNYVIYTFSVPFGPLFLLWVAVFGISLFALIGGLSSANYGLVRQSFTGKGASKVAAWCLMIIAVLFGLLWLSEDIPALLAGRTPQSLIDMALPTNPVHILDLAFFLPAVFGSGIMLLKRVPFAYVVAVPAILFLILTGIPILITPWVSAPAGGSGWGVLAPIGTLTALLTGLLVWLLSTIHPGLPANSPA
jgi:hypothetical protein